MSRELNRRHFVAAASAGAALGYTRCASAASTPAMLGGDPLRTTPFPSWPIVSPSHEQAVLEVVRAGRWYRDRSVEEFEERFAKMNEAKYCVACSSGTSALYSTLGVGPGDEVIVPPYTFMATVAVVLQHKRPYGFTRHCCSARGATWTRSPKPSARSIPTLPRWTVRKPRGGD